MHRFHTIMLVASILLCSLIHPARAQTSPTPTPAANAVRWNGLDVSRLPNAYQTIIGVPGTQIVLSSDTASSLGLNLPVTLPITINLFGISFAGGSTAYLGIGGYLCFNSSATKSVSNYLLYPDATYKWVVAPYWSDLRTTGQSGQGIFQRFQITGGGDSIWTIEWSVEAIDPPRSSGRFQLQFIKHPALVAGGIPWLETLFHYDQAASLARPVPGSLGAQVGMKNLGQPVGIPPSSTASGTDDSLYLLMTPETLLPLPAGGPSITRLPTQVIGGFNVPDWTATATSPASSYFHYEMPDSSCKLKPIDTDTPPTLGCPPLVDAFGYGFVFLTGEAIAIPVSVKNEGYLPAYDIPVQVRIYNGESFVVGASETIDSLLPGDTATVYCNVGELAAGSYRVVAITSTAADHFRDNDSVARRLIVRPTTDIMPFTIDSPTLGQSIPRAQVGQPVNITGTVAGIGTETASKIYYSFRVRDMDGQLVAPAEDSSTTLIPSPGEKISIPFGFWTPGAPGDYVISIRASAEGDEIPSDDLLAGYPSVNRFVRGGLSTPLTFDPVPFQVFDQHDPAVGNIGPYPFLPAEGDSVLDSALVMATFVNNGASDEPSLMAHFRIENSMGMPVYDQWSTIADLAGGGGIRTVMFPTFVPTAGGSYWAEAWIDGGPPDDVGTNNHVRWQFEVDLGEMPKQARSRTDDAGWSVAPNPARDQVLVTLAGVIPGGARIVLSDLLGTPVRVQAIGEGAPGSLSVDLAGLPAGLYTIRLEGGDGTRSALPLMVRH